MSSRLKTGKKYPGTPNLRKFIYVALLLCLIQGLILQRPSIISAASGLTAGYGFVEGTGTITADSSGNRLTGTLVGGAAWGAGKNGSGVSLNGTTSYVDLGNPAALQLTGSMTLSSWVYETANVADDGQIIAKSNGSGGWQLKSTPDTGPRTFAIKIAAASGASVHRYSTTVRALNTWYHVAGVYDAAARTLNIYVNGALANGTISATVPSSQVDAPVNVNIGRRTGGFYLKGTVDDVRIYNRALSAAEIQADMAAPVSGGGTPDTTPPSAPASLTATAISASQINLSWPASTDNVGVTGYQVLRGGSQIATTTVPSFSDTGLSPSTSYTYAVTASDQAGNTSAPSPTASATTPSISFDFALSNDGNKSLTQGASTTSVVTATLASGSAQPVTFGASGLPSGVTVAFSPTSCSPPCSATTTITSSAGTPAGTSTVTITGTAGALSHSTTFSLSVNAPAVLVAGYGFGEGSGTSTFDQSSNSLTGTLVGGPVWTGGKNGSGLSFNGVTAYVDLGNPAALQMTGSMSLSAWVFETSNVADDGQIISKSDGASGWQLKSTPDTGVRTFGIKITSSTGASIQRYSSTVRSLNTWYHVTSVYDAAARTLNIYVNGTLANGVLSGTVPSSQLSAAGNANIGRRTGGFYINGTVDDVRVYNRALTLAEIQADMAAPVGPTVPDSAPPSVVVTAPAAGTLLAGTATVTASASDNVAVSGVQFLVDGSPLGAEDTSAPYSIAWNTATTSSNPHTVSARARDAAGNTSTATNVGVVVDNEAPTGTIVINGGAAVTNNTGVTLALNAADRLSGVTQMRFSNTGTTYSTAEPYAASKAWTLTTGQGTKTVFVQFMDTLGNWSAAFTDTIVYDTTAPVISAVSSSNLTANSATISWTTNEAATSRVEYGTTTAYGASTILDSSLVTAHSATLSSLASLTLYNYRVRSIDAAGNEQVSANGTFTTGGTDTVPPSAPTAVTATPTSSTQVTVNWTASTDNVAVTGYDVYRNGDLVGSPAGASFVDSGLAPATTYSYVIDARDAAGNVSPASSAANAVTPAFLISNVSVSAVTTTSAQVAWNTDQPATGQVEYGTTLGYGSLSAFDAGLSTTHAQGLSALTPNTTYHFRVHSTDASNHPVVSNDFTFRTNASTSAGVFQNEVLISGLSLPTAIKFLPDGHMLALELGGRIRRIHMDDWTVDPVPFLTLTNIGTLNGQQGLMDLVLDPAFDTNHYYYIFYTLGSPNRDRVSRFTANADLSGTVAGSEFVIYEDPQTANSEHHGGALNFANDGKLLVTTGEHFNADDSQSLTSPRGKVLRFNSDGTVPTDNPFYDGAGPNVDAIWALGLRNPFRAFYDAPTGRFYIGDVGGNDYSTAEEEVNLGAPRANYGWPICEGSSCGSNPSFTSPWFAYPHNGRDASITGGFIYRGTQFPAQYFGNYFYADYAQNWIRRLTLDANGNVTGAFNFEPPDGSADGPYGDIVYLAQGPDGSLYYVDLGYSDTTGQQGISKIRRIRFISSDQPPTASSSAQPTQGQAPLTVTFSSGGSNDPEGALLTYSWTFGDGATSTEANPVHTYSQKGMYSVRLSVSDGTNVTFATPLTIAVGTRPVASILAPQTGLVFRAGDVIAFSGNGTDLEDGTLPASAFTWNIDFLHEGHVHPGLPQVGTKSGTFTIPTSGHDFSGNTRYQITLTVTDSDGLQSSQSVTIYPDKVNLSFDTVPSGLTVTLDGIAHLTPFVHDTLIGFTHALGAPDQTFSGLNYAFASWSDSGAQQHDIQVPANAQSFVATFTGTQPAVPPGLVAGYRFSEGSGSTTADISGNSNTGVLTDAPVWTTGQYNGGLSFTGSSYVNLGNGASLQLTGSMTLSAWIRISAQPADDGAIIAKLDGAGWQLKTSPDTGVRTAAIQISSDGSDSVQRYSSTILSPNTWYHLAGVYNAQAGTLDIYVNGILDNGDLQGTVPTSQFNSPVNAQIGQRPGSPGLFNFLGIIDEVHVFNRGLTSAEIQTDMSTPR